MRRSDAIRADVHARLGAAAAAMFAERADLHSLTMLVAQYYSDEAADQVHVRFRASTRRVLLWPTEDPASGVTDLGVDGEESHEGIEIVDDDLIVGFAAYCLEGCSQGGYECERYRPYAIVRRDAGLEIVGTVHQSWALDSDDDDDDGDGDDADEGREAPGHEAPDPHAVLDTEHARELLADISRDRADPHPRSVLADHLEEHGIDLAAHIAPERWLGPLAPYAQHARLDRGVLASLELATQDPLTAGAIASPHWLALDELRLAPWTNAAAALPGILAVPRRFRTLTMPGTDAAALDCFLAADTLWELRALDLTGVRDPLAFFERWRLAFCTPKLEHLTLDEPVVANVEQWGYRPDRLRVTLRLTAGWALTLAPDRTCALSQSSWEPAASLVQLVDLLERLAPYAEIIGIPALVASRYWDPDAAVRRAIVELGGSIEAP